MFKFVTAAALALIASLPASGQSAATPFDVASVKPAAPCCAAGQWRESKAMEDRIDFRYVTLRYCIAFAYRLKEFQVSGPSWLGETRYDIVAKGPAGTKTDQLPDMVRQLLADRFKLQAHRETKEFNVFVISLGKNGPKLTESARKPDDAEGAHIGMSMSPAGGGRIEVKNGNMTALAGTLSRILGHPVVDQTGLTARYDFDLDYLREDSSGAFMPGSAGAPPPLNSEAGISVFSSIRQLGLSLDARKTPLPAIVVDQAEKTPVEN